MTTDIALSTLKTYIDEHISDDIDVHIAGDIQELLAPFIDITTEGSEEHEVLRGVLDISVRMRIATIPRDENTGRAIADELYDIIGDPQALISWTDDNIDDLRIFDARGYEMETRADSDLTMSEITFTLTACKIY
jgi:hypothetical protein